MRIGLLSAVLAFTLAMPLAGQAGSEWRTVHGLPIAVVEVSGGDVECFAALLPADAAPPASVSGFPATSTPRWSGLLWTFRVPAVLAGQAAEELAHAVAGTGAAAVVALGAASVGQLGASLAALEGTPSRPVARAPCTIADGGVAVRRGAPERVELVLALPAVDDARFDLLPALAAWVQLRLAGELPAVRVRTDLASGCPRLVALVGGSDEPPRATLRRLRRHLAELAASTPSAEEVARVQAAVEAAACRVAVGGERAAVELAERLALGGSAAGALASPEIDSPALAELARAVFAGHAGLASIVEEERRARVEVPITLDNGVVVSVKWIPGETAAVAIALGGLDPTVANGTLTGLATAAARQGWAAEVREIAGVATVSVAAPAGAVADVLEQLSEGLGNVPPASTGDLGVEVGAMVGLRERLTAETLSVALALPPEAEVGSEAAGKFFGSISSGGVRSGTATAGPGLSWTVDGGPPHVVGVADLPPTAAGLVAGEVVRSRLVGVQVHWLTPPGHLLLAVTGEGEAHVPALEARLAGQWKDACRPASVTEVGSAGLRVYGAFFGDLVQATARLAATPFLPVVPSEPALLGILPGEVNQALAALPAWDGLIRMAHGPAPQVVVPVPGRGGVRESPPRRPGKG